MENPELGQVFTKKEIAEYMVDCFQLPPRASFLDPCFGEGIFIDCLLEAGYLNITGVELDPILFSHYRQSRRRGGGEEALRLICGDFLSLSDQEQFDGIIMNPPYIRHEKIGDLEGYGISKERLTQTEPYLGLHKTANLYMYFVIKAISLLKKSGEMVVIFPHTWLSTKRGEQFQRQIEKYCRIDNIVEIEGQPFKGDPLVDVVVMKLVKERERPFDEGAPFKRALSNHDLLCRKLPLDGFAHVRRGLTTGYNELFVNPNLNVIQGKSLGEKNVKPILSSPKDVTGFSVQKGCCDRLLVVDNIEEAGDGAREYLNYHRRLIEEKKKPQTLYEKIVSQKKWYSLRLFDCKGILFSYIVRNQMRFVMNETDCVVRDNFYVITPKINSYLLFSLLNNYYTYIQLEQIGKRYGSGLLKLQKYDMEELLVVNPNLLSNWEKRKLEEYGKLLITESNEDYIGEITKTLQEYEAFSAKEAKERYETCKKNRLLGGRAWP